MVSRRVRGAILRLALNRRAALLVGLALSLPALWLFLVDYWWEVWYTDALALVIGGSGAALALAGLMGRKPDWIE